MTNEDEYFFCECEYDAKCMHLNNDNLTELTLTYLTSTCPICIYKTTKSCGKNEDDCCIKRMETRDGFVNLYEAVHFSTNCYHCLYEPHYINFCIEGNLFENAMRHIIRYFNFINRSDYFTSQRLMMVNLNLKYVKSVSISGGGVNNVSDLPYLNAICESSTNGVRCANCEMQHPKRLWCELCKDTSKDK